MRDLNAQQKEDYLWDLVADAFNRRDHKALSVASTRMYYYFKKKDQTQLPVVKID